TLGLAVYVALAGWFVLGLTWLLRRRLFTWLLQLAGWALLVSCAALLLDGLPHHHFTGPVAGNGGSLGAWLITWQQTNCSKVGGGALTATAGLFGIVLAGGRLTRYLALVTGRRLTRALRRSAIRLARSERTGPIFEVRVRHPDDDDEPVLVGHDELEPPK